MSVGAVNKNTGDRIPTAGMPAIDNALDLTSSNPVQNAVITAALANKQDKTDNALQTTDKTIVGAINEHEGDISSLMNGLINVESKVVYEAGSLSFGVVDVGETKHMRVTLPAKTGYTLASANGHLNYADSAVVSCQITDDTTLDVYATNTQSFALADQTLVYSLIYVKTSV